MKTTPRKATINVEISRMNGEHEFAGGAMDKINEITKGYVGCRRLQHVQSCLQITRRVWRWLHTHVPQNNILFPKLYNLPINNKWIQRHKTLNDHVFILNNRCDVGYGWKNEYQCRSLWIGGEPDTQICRRPAHQRKICYSRSWAKKGSLPSRVLWPWCCTNMQGRFVKALAKVCLTCWSDGALQTVYENMTDCTITSKPYW